MAKGAFFWDYSGYSYSGLGIAEYTEFQFQKEPSFSLRLRRISHQKFLKRTRILSIPSKPYSFHSVHSAIGSRMNNIQSVHSENGIAPKRTKILSIPSIPVPE